MGVARRLRGRAVHAGRRQQQIGHVQAGRHDRHGRHAVPERVGLYDTLGNVWEWVQDVYNDKVMPDAKPPSKGRHRVLKGAGYFSHVANVVSTVHAGGPGDPFCTGFRVVKDLK